MTLLSSAARGADQVAQLSSRLALTMTAHRYPGFFSGMSETLHSLNVRSLSDIDRSTAANDPQPSASFSVLKNPQRIPVNTPPVFQGLRPRIWPPLLRLVTKAISDMLLGDRTIGILEAAREGEQFLARICRLAFILYPTHNPPADEKRYLVCLVCLVYLVERN